MSVEVAVRLAREDGSWLVGFEGIEGDIDLFAGDFAAAESHYRRALELAEGMPGQSQRMQRRNVEARLDSMRAVVRRADVELSPANP